MIRQLKDFLRNEDGMQALETVMILFVAVLIALSVVEVVRLILSIAKVVIDDAIKS